LKAKYGFGVWSTASGYMLGTDDFGFSAQPGGTGRPDGSFYDLLEMGNWWTSSGVSGNSGSAWSFSMYWNQPNMGSNNSAKSDLNSVRCIKQ